MTAVLSNSTDHVERLAVLKALEKNGVVTAGAGTGKTTLLIDRLALLVIGVGIPIEKIVALTFTKKAGEEMRVRLEERLRWFVIPVEDRPVAGTGSFLIPILEEQYLDQKSEWVKRAETALADMPKAKIGTIHSFASDLLKLYPIQSRVDPRFQVDEGSALDLVFNDEWNKFLTKELDLKSPRTTLWKTILEKVKLSDLKDLAKLVLDDAGPTVHFTLAEEAAAITKTHAEQLSSVLKRNGEPVKGKSFIPLFHASLDLCRLWSADAQIKEDVKEIVSKTKLGEVPKTWGLSPVDEQIVIEGIKWAKTLVLIDDQTAHQIKELLTPFFRIFRAEQDRRGLLKFNDLLWKTRDLLKNHRDVRNALKKQFSVFLVDEFQDTDPLQGEIVFYLAEEINGKASSWKQVKLRPGALFVVGDPKQSIYRFRGADMAAFEQFCDEMVRQGAVQSTLTNNFRTVPSILSSVNKLFTPVMIQQKNVQPVFSPLQPGRLETGGQGLEIMAINAPEKGEDGKKISADAIRWFEAEHIAQWIEKNVQEKNSHSMKYGDIALLFRSTTSFSIYLEALKNAGIPFLAEGAKFFYGMPEILSFQNLMGTIANPEDKLSLVGFLRSPVGGLTDLEIFDLSKKEELSIRTKSPSSPAADFLYSKLRRLHQKTLTTPLIEIIQESLSETNFLEIWSQSGFGEQALANVRKLIGLAEKWSEVESLTLSGFLQRLRYQQQENTQEGENPLADAMFDAVKVMTIHKAKGLEFKTVFLPDLTRKKSSSEGRKTSILRDWESNTIGFHLSKSGVINSAQAVLAMKQVRHEEAESVRVFYVASTRAKDKMIFSIWHKEKPHGVVGPYLNESGLWPKADQQEIIDNQTPSIPVAWSAYKPVRLRRKSSIKTLPFVEELASQKNIHKFKEMEKFYVESISKRRFLSPSHLAHEKEKIRIPTDNEESLVNDPIRLGLLCHKVLEDWDFSLAPEKFDVSLKRMVSKTAGFFEILPSDAASQLLLQEALEILTVFLNSDAYKKIATGKIMGKEIPFLYRLDFEAESPVMRGVIDLIYESQNQMIIADYKTNKINDQSIKSISDSYHAQGKAYADALEKVLKIRPQFELIFLRAGQTIQLKV